jgi:hypothetical protein
MLRKLKTKIQDTYERARDDYPRITWTRRASRRPSSLITTNNPRPLRSPSNTMQPAHTSIYNMLLTLLFYTTASICALRTATWLSLHALLPVLSRILSHCYNHYHRHSNSKDATTRHDAIPSSSLAGSGGTLFKLVRTAAGHVLFVPVSTANTGQADNLSTASEWRTATSDSESIPSLLLLLRNAMMLGLWLTSFLGTILIAYYPYHYIQAVSSTAQNQKKKRNAPRPPSYASCFSLLLASNDFLYFV